MAEKLTPQQRQAVENRGGKLLVSAAAGSGKTKVLVDRLMSYLLNPVDPANLDEFLIITYTKAAAAELRGKISAKLTERMAENPDNRHLQRQMQRLYLTKISTVHAFCGDILREYAYRLDLPGDFRVADEQECTQLREAAMTKILDEAYLHVHEDADFRAFVDTQGLGRDDRLVPEILLKVYDSARCHLDPDGWLDRCLENANVSGLSDAGQTLWGRYLMEDLFSYLDLQIEAMGLCVEAASQAEGMEKPAALLNDTLYQLRCLRNCGSWDQIVSLGQPDYGRLVISKKCPDQELGDRIKAVRAACKKGLEKKLRGFADPSARILQDLQQSWSASRGMVSIVRRFDAEFSRAKKARRILDFGDLEHKTLDLLLGTSRSGPTAAAREIGQRFREIMVDEYQDSNAVQDAIFSTLTAQKQNCFMVGDVKQSIYQFRLADPGIFLEKYEQFANADDTAPGEGRKVLLSHNFRSGGAVLAGVNDIFRLCMSKNVGGLVYGPQEALNEGIPHVPLGEPEVELHAIDVRESTYEEEAAFVAHRIRELLDGTHYVRQSDSLRPIQPEDIAILLRSPGSVGGEYRSALEAVGIRCVTGGGEDLLQTEEIGVLRSILQTVSNPRQDIPLISMLASPAFGFTADDLAAFRGGNRGVCIFDALRSSDHPKAAPFLEMLEILRREARIRPLDQLIQRIYSLTHLDSLYASMPGGKAREENLRTFYQLAVDYEATGHRDLEQFLEHLDALEGKGLVGTGEQSTAGAVTLMSIHKSKGLEFPVVFVSSLSREFNRESIRAQVLCDQTLGLGLAAVDEHLRVRYPTVAKRAIAAKITSDSLSEELRVLYVALTRARDRLIMTYASRTLEKDIADTVQRLGFGNMELLTRDVVCPGEWVLMAALKRTEAGELFALGGRPTETTPGVPAWKICVSTAPQSDQAVAAVEGDREETTVPPHILQQLKSGLAFRYAYTAATQAPSKQTATDRKGREKDEEAAENTAPPRSAARIWRKPRFTAPESRGAAYGTATHTAMQHIRFEVCTDEEAIRREIQRLVEEDFLTSDQAALVRPEKLAAFFATDLGRKIRTAKNVLREFKFSILDDGANFDPALRGEQILLQGVVDCAVVEDDGIILVDFKTDFVMEENVDDLLARYRPQVKTYADALSRIYRLTVKEAYLYLFSLDRFVRVD